MNDFISPMRLALEQAWAFVSNNPIRSATDFRKTVGTLGAEEQKALKTTLSNLADSVDQQIEAIPATVKGKENIAPHLRWAPIPVEGHLPAGLKASAHTPEALRMLPAGQAGITGHIALDFDDMDRAMTQQGQFAQYEKLKGMRGRLGILLRAIPMLALGVLAVSSLWSFGKDSGPAQKV
jgi:hypothetical protein